MTHVLIRKREETHSGRRPCDDRGRDWSDESTNQETPRLPATPEVRRARKDPPLEPSERTQS